MRRESRRCPARSSRAGPSAGQDPGFGVADTPVPGSPPRLTESLCGVPPRAGKCRQPALALAGPHLGAEGRQVAVGCGARQQSRVGWTPERLLCTPSRRPFSPQRGQPKSQYPYRSDPRPADKSSDPTFPYSGSLQIQRRIQQILTVCHRVPATGPSAGHIEVGERTWCPPRWSSQSGGKDPHSQ